MAFPIVKKRDEFSLPNKKLNAKPRDLPGSKNEGSVPNPNKRVRLCSPSGLLSLIPIVANASTAEKT
jgi:hypothetical protein